MGVKPWVAVAAAAAAWISSACGSETPGPAVAVRDSAGVTLVENAAVGSDVRAPWTVAAEPSLSIGVLDGPEEYQLFRVADAVRLDDGRLAVVNSGSSEVRVYDGRGAFLDRWGGKGEGPGEFMDPSRIVRWSGDSLAIWDRRLRRLTVLGPGGGLGRAWVLPAAGDLESPVFQDALDDGSLVVTSPVFSGTPPDNGLQRLPVTVAVTTPDGVLAGSLGSHRGREAVLDIRPDAISIYRLPFARDLVVEAAGARVLIAPTDRMELSLWSPEGTLSRVVRVAGPPRLLTDAEFEGAMEVRASQVPEEARAGLRRTWRELPRSDTLPAFHAVVVSRGGDLWVEPYRLPQAEGPVDWLVLDADGRAVGRVALPGGLQVFEIGTDYVLGMTRDELEVEHVQMWPLRKGAAGGG